MHLTDMFIIKEHEVNGLLFFENILPFSLRKVSVFFLSCCCNNAMATDYSLRTVFEG